MFYIQQFEHFDLSISMHNQRPEAVLQCFLWGLTNLQAQAHALHLVRVNLLLVIRAQSPGPV